MKNIRLIIAGLLLLILAAMPVKSIAGVSCTLPFNLQNGTIADATQVMANYNALVTCLTNAAAAGVNSDITALTGITTPITYTQGGTPVYTGGTSTGSANAQVVATTIPTGFGLTKNLSIIFTAGFSNTGATTLAVNGTTATNVFKMTSSGPVALTGGEIQAGQIVWCIFDGTEYQFIPPISVTGGYGISVGAGGVISISSTAPPAGFEVPINLGLTASVASSALTLNVTTQGGSTPSATNPVLVPFRSGGSVTSGGITWAAITASLSLTVPSGATLGTSNSVPFRIWIFLARNNGTPTIGVATCSNTTTVFPCSSWETNLTSVTTISGLSTSGGTLYSSVTQSDFIRMIGYCDYSSGLGTAGAYASSCTALQIFGPGVKKPGDFVQGPILGVRNSQTATSSTTFVTSNITASITPSSTINLIQGSFSGDCQPDTGAAQTIIVQPTRVSTQIATPQTIASGASNNVMVCSDIFLDAPATTSSTAYAPFFKTGSGGGADFPVTNGKIMLWEIMGAAEPANDNRLLQLTG